MNYNTNSHQASFFSHFLLPTFQPPSSPTSQLPNKNRQDAVQANVKPFVLGLLCTVMVAPILHGQNPVPGNTAAPLQRSRPVRVAPKPAPNVRPPITNAPARAAANIVAYSAALGRYQHARHTRYWWKRHFTTFVLVSGGYYYFDSGYWFPAWGYDPDYEAYDYDGPIFTYGNLLPDQVIVNVQRALQDRGYYGGGISGGLSPATRRAISAFQQDEGLEINGVVDGPTVYALGLI